MTHDVECALDSLLQTAGLGGLGPNTVVCAWPDSWRQRIAGAARVKQILTSAHAFNMALILIKGIDAWPGSNQQLARAVVRATESDLARFPRALPPLTRFRVRRDEGFRHRAVFTNAFSSMFTSDRRFESQNMY